MLKTFLAIALIVFAAVLVAQEPVVQRATFWSDTVKRGDMAVTVRALGVLGTDRTAQLQVAETQAAQVQFAQNVTMDTRKGLVEGKVVRVGPEVVNGTVAVDVELAGAPPAEAHAGDKVDASIRISELKDAVYVGRPVFGKANSDDTIFKLEADGIHATRVKVHFGRASVNTIEIQSGLEPGDRVILSDMTPFERQDRVRLQ